MQLMVAAPHGALANTYSYSNKKPESCARSRRYVNGCGAQRLSKCVRTRIFGHLVDVDMKSAHIGFALDLARICQFENMCGDGTGVEVLDYVRRWRDNSEELSALLRAAGISDPKKAVLKILYGGSAPEVGPSEVSKKAADFLNGFVASARFLR